MFIGDTDRNKFCIHVKRFFPKNTARFLYNQSCNNFQLFAATRCVAEDGSATKCKPPIRPRRLLSPNRACRFFYLCLPHFKSTSLRTLFQNNFFSKPTTRVTRLAADSAAASTALLDFIALFEFEVSLIS